MYHTSKRRTDPLFRESQGKGLRVERSGFYFRSWHRQGFTSCARALPFVAEFYRCRYYTCFFAKILQLVQIHWFVLSPSEVFKRFPKQHWKSFFFQLRSKEDKKWLVSLCWLCLGSPPTWSCLLRGGEAVGAMGGSLMLLLVSEPHCLCEEGSMSRVPSSMRRT